MAVITSLVSYWALDEASGNAIDSHGSNTLTDNNTVAAATGKVSGARDFELDNTESFSVADNASLSVPDQDFSFAVWVNPESGAARNEILSKGGASDLSYSLLRAANSGFSFYVSSGVGFQNGTFVDSSAGAPSSGSWYFVVCWHDATANTTNIQVNDGSVDSTSFTFGTYDDVGDFALGQEPFYGNYYDGLLDEVGFWKKVLTSTERTWLYNSGAGRSYADIVAEGGAAATLRQWRMGRLGVQ